MKTFSVSLDVVSSRWHLNELTTQLGTEPSSDSHDLGSPRGRNQAWQVTIWRFGSQEPESASLEHHCENVLSRANSAGVLKSLRSIPDIRATMNIAVFFDTASCSVLIPSASLEVMARYGLQLLVTCYPSERQDERTYNEGSAP